jgi:hypothetical protein
MAFPSESGVERFRGDVSGRQLAGVSGGQSITRLPSQVTPFNPLASSEVVSSLNPAERAAIGVISTSSTSNTSTTAELPPLIGEAPEEGRFPGLEEGRFPGLTISEGGSVEESTTTGGEASAEGSGESSSEPASPSDPTAPNGEVLSEEEVREVEQLERRDQEVRTHEQAHLSAAGPHARGGMKLSYTTGPDGGRYVTDGEVGIDLSPESTPEATISKMQTVRRAALAPAQPSGADRAVAAAASQYEQEARVELQEQRQAELQAQQEQASAARETKREEEGTERAGSVEINEGAESFAGAQAVQPDANVTPKGPSLEPRSLDVATQARATVTPSETSRPVEGPTRDRAPTPKRAVMRSPDEESSSEPSSSEAEVTTEG